VLIDGRSGCVEASKMKVDLNAACLELGNFQYLYSTFDFKGYHPYLSVTVNLLSMIAITVIGSLDRKSWLLLDEVENSPIIGEGLSMLLQVQNTTAPIYGTSVD
jgi:hypothetical protein